MGKEPGKGHHFGESNSHGLKPSALKHQDSGQGPQLLSLSSLPFLSRKMRKNIYYPEILRPKRHSSSDGPRRNVASLSEPLVLCPEGVISTR